MEAMIARYRTSKVSLKELYKALGISKQAVHQHRHRVERRASELAILEDAVDQIRTDHPGCGLEKMYFLLRPGCIGRDRFITHFQSLGYGVRRKRNPVITTHALRDRYHPNLINGLEISGIDHVWQTDITYILVGDRYYYLTFIIDVYSRRILGYAVSDRLYASANIRALRMALKERSGNDLSKLIHHSDRGSQYIDRGYQSILRTAGVHQISMCEQAQENAYTERLNGILKQEYLSQWKITSYDQLKRKVKRAVKNYNQDRPHNSLLNRMSPLAFENWLEQFDTAEHPSLKIKAYQPGKQ